MNGKRNRVLALLAPGFTLGYSTLMKLLLATGLYPPEIGGPATYARLMEAHLPSLGIEVDVLPFSTVRHLPRMVRHLAYTRALYQRAKHADLIFVQDTVSTGLPVLLAAILCRKPYALRVPGDYAWEQGVQRYGVTDGIDDFQKKTYGPRIALMRLVQRAVARRAAFVIAPSVYFATVVQRWGVPESRIHAIYNSIEYISPRPARQAGETLTIVAVGRLVPWKGFDALVRVMRRLPAWRLTIVGDGRDRARLEALARAEGVADRVRFTGALPRAEVFATYDEATVFVHLSAFESFSYQIAEALARGVPIIAAGEGSVPELIEDKVEGVLVSRHDEDALVHAIESVRKESAIWHDRVEAGKRKAAYFQPKPMLKRVVALLQEAV
jgi:glycosyltransferase involved in cell wall biosynthesis